MVTQEKLREYLNYWLSLASIRLPAGRESPTISGRFRSTSWTNSTRATGFRRNCHYAAPCLTYGIGSDGSRSRRTRSSSGSWTGFASTYRL